MKQQGSIKTVSIIGLGAIGCFFASRFQPVLGIPFGAWSVSDDANFIREALMREVIAIANKKGIDLSEKDMADQARRLTMVPPKNKPSTLQDIEAGRKTEVDMFGGTIMRLGRELGVPTPYNELFYHAVKVLEQKNEGLF